MVEITVEPPLSMQTTTDGRGAPVPVANKLTV
jgi:hypothetical protein